MRVPASVLPRSSWVCTPDSSGLCEAPQAAGPLSTGVAVSKRGQRALSPGPGAARGRTAEAAAPRGPLAGRGRDTVRVAQSGPSRPWLCAAGLRSTRGPGSAAERRPGHRAAGSIPVGAPAGLWGVRGHPRPLAGFRVSLSLPLSAIN